MHYQVMIEKGLLPADLDDMPKYEQQPGMTIGVNPVNYVLGTGIDSYNSKCHCTVCRCRRSKDNDIIAMTGVKHIPLETG